MRTVLQGRESGEDGSDGVQKKRTLISPFHTFT